MDNERIEKKPIKGIGGWLLIFIITLFLKPAILYYTYSGLLSSKNILNIQIPWFKTYAYILLAIEIVLSVLGIITGIYLLLLKKNALKLINIYLIAYVACIVLVYLVLYFIIPSEGTNKQIVSSLSTRQIIQVLIYFGIWFGFFKNSERVKNTYQHGYSSNL